MVFLHREQVTGRWRTEAPGIKGEERLITSSPPAGNSLALVPLGSSGRCTVWVSVDLHHLADGHSGQLSTSRRYYPLCAPIDVWCGLGAAPWSV